MKHTHRRTFPGLQRIGQSNKGTSHALRNGIIAVALALAGTSAAMGAARVGPIDPSNGYPLFYEDEAGLRLELCTDLANCFFLPPDSGLPTSFPDNFPDEAFFWAAESIMSDATTGSNATLVMAREAAFFNGPVLDGDQVVFSRIRLYIDGAPQMVGNHYTVTHPYGTVEFDSVPGDAGPGVKGEGLSTTQDVGIGAPGEFTEALNLFPVFLTPVDQAGTLSAGSFMVDSSALGTGTQLTGSPYDTNFFRIEGAEIGTVYPSYQCADAILGGVTDANGVDVLTDCVELDLFAIQGRVATRHGVDIDKAVYEKVGSSTGGETTYVNVWAHSVEGQQLIVSVDGGIQVPMTEGSGGNYFTRLGESSDYTRPLRKPMSVAVSNLTDLPFSDKTSGIIDQVSITESYLDTSTGLLHILAQSSNKVDDALLSIDVSASSQIIPGSLTDDGLGTVSATLLYSTPTETGVPPQRLAIQSMEGGYAVRDVEIIGSTTNGGSIELLAANAGADQTVVAGTTVSFSGVDSVGAIVAYTWGSQLGFGFSCDTASCSSISVATPVDNQGLDKLVVDFTLTISDALGATSSDIVRLTATNPNVIVSDICTIVAAEYRSDKDQWRINGTSDVTDNQLISVYLGLGPLDVNSKLIGTTRVDALGVWDMRTGRGDGIAIPTSADTEVWIESERGCQESIAFLLR